jgi:hypothetical protein
MVSSKMAEAATMSIAGFLAPVRTAALTDE